MSIILLNDFLNANNDEANEDSIDWARKLFHEDENTDYFDRNVNCVCDESGTKKRKASETIRDVVYTNRFESMKKFYASELSDKTLNCMRAYYDRNKLNYNHFQNMHMLPSLRTKIHSYLQREFMRDLKLDLSSPKYTAFRTGHENKVRNKVMYTLFCFNGLLKVSMKENCNMHSLVLAYNRGKLNEVSQGNENMEGRSCKCWEVLDVFNLPTGQSAPAAAEAFFLKLTKQVLEMHVLRPEEVVKYENSTDYKRSKEEEYFGYLQTMEENLNFYSIERRKQLKLDIAEKRKKGLSIQVPIISWSDFTKSKNLNYLVDMQEQGRFNIFTDKKNEEIYKNYLDAKSSDAENDSLLSLSREVGLYVYDFLKFVFDDAARIEILRQNGILF